ncbi:MAG TPA: hypothetical protein DEA08_07405 [Planctomycetes bacterium]|nr:hypothetical protein [Planctomycetota bacterium]
MLPCSNQGLGENIGFPDVCNTPIGTGTAPLPYPNLGSNAMGLPFLPTCFLSLMPGHNQMAKPMMTNGDNAGVAHSSFMMMGGNNLGNIRVLLTGGPAETLLNPTQGNNYNCSTNAKLVPSITNILMSDLGGPNFAPRADLIGDTAWLEWRRCTLASATLLRRALPALEQRGARRAVLDLRGNPGGQLSAAALLAAAFLPANSTAIEARSLGASSPSLRWETTTAGATLPLVILVDASTASAAEALAASLQQHGRAVIVGEPSHGKEQVDLLGSRWGSTRRPGGLTQGRVQPQRVAPALAVVDVALDTARKLS